AKVTVRGTDKLVTVLRDATYVSQLRRLRTDSTQRRGRMNSQRNSTTARMYSPIDSASSLNSSHRESTHARMAPSSRKRGVDFSRVRQKRIDYRPRNKGGKGPASIPGDSATVRRDYKSPVSPCKRKARNAGPSPEIKVGEPQDAMMFLNEELRHFINTIAPDCDDAFNSSLI